MPVFPTSTLIHCYSCGYPLLSCSMEQSCLKVYISCTRQLPLFPVGFEWPEMMSGHSWKMDWLYQMRCVGLLPWVSLRGKQLVGRVGEPEKNALKLPMCSEAVSWEYAIQCTLRVCASVQHEIWHNDWLSLSILMEFNSHVFEGWHDYGYIPLPS